MKKNRYTLKLSQADEVKELEFELDYLASLTFEERLIMMRKKSREMLRQMIEHGHRRPFEVIKRCKVEFVVIGATAFPIHGYARATLGRTCPVKGGL